MNPNTIIIDQKDNVAVALKDIPEGETICLPNGEEFQALTRIAFSHKVVLKDLSGGDDIIKYGEVIAQVTQDVKKGEWIHVHNLNVMEDS
jgi:altronate dehydratase small subunit